MSKPNRNSRIQTNRYRSLRKVRARKILVAKFHVDGGTVSGLPGIVRAIRHFCPDLSIKFENGHDLIRAFVGEQVEVKQKQNGKRINPNADDFLESYAWRKLRMEALKKFGAQCQCCGATPGHGVRIHVDHIKPRRLFPELAMDITNLQVLCEDCNHGKGNWDQTDWRPDDSALEQKPNIH